ncbi:MAG: tripartite tricarboxylate transporter substrate binding protein [Polaromonas sp.]|uniref:Bug family tripartite tricarboxylate transporter substrate binding protein n=1 Tax=Polaromonas sp. TaxID=1869339 RepID=UPI0027349ED8|nr:tripartite tricarboxylate transporter substrate binding protein [Polaromonas sp.]MDP3797348.1 tripartite tricarboxylate transporter substrate binding protein [Polaromonas sp.]
MKFTRRLVVAMAASIAAVLPVSSAVAQVAYPSKPITIVVAYPAGGDTDVLARLFGEKLSTRLGQPVIVENRSGAAGTIGSASVAKAPADGYTLLMAPNTLAIAPHVLKAGTAHYDAVNDFSPIIQLGSQSLFVIATTASGVTSVKDLVTNVKTGKIQSYASPGNGSPMHILAELFAKSAGVKITQVPYRGSVPAVADMVGGHVPMMYGTLGPVAQHVATGRLVILAVADPQRSPFLPNVPTLAELGYKDAEVGAWQALVGPKGMPADIVKTLNSHLNEILKMPDVVARMAMVATAPAGGDSAKLGKLIASDYVRYGKIVKEFGIQAD